jgi:hypothetical protein
LLLGVLCWQGVVAVTASFDELFASAPAERVEALLLDADARRTRNLGEDDALYLALRTHLEGADPKLALIFPGARPGRLFEPEMLVLADHLRALLFPTPVRSYSASRPVPAGFASSLDPSWYLVDRAAGASGPWARAFRLLAAGDGWSLLRFSGAP